MTAKQIRNSFGSNLQSEREYRQWTQAELAQRTGLTAAWICHFERGRRTPSLVNLVRLVEALECRLDDLVPYA